MGRPPSVLVFDVNETLLDLGALEPLFARLCGDGSLPRTWFRKVLESAFVGEILNETGPFARHGLAALEAVCAERGAMMRDGAGEELAASMGSLPPHPEVPEALARLRADGYTLAALTNNSVDTVERQFAAAGIRDLFDHVISVDASGHLKPHPAVYETAIARLGEPPAGLRMVAAHDFDVRGAMGVGMAGAFVARPGQMWNPRYPRPDVWGGDLAAVAHQLMDG